MNSQRVCQKQKRFQQSDMRNTWREIDHDIMSNITQALIITEAVRAACIARAAGHAARRRSGVRST